MSGGPQIRVGIGGWVFPPWRGVFYPPGLPQARELDYASRQLTTIEINGTFYGPQKPESFRRWHDATPEDFVFSIKGPRFATHRPDLAGAGALFDRFFSSGVLELRDKLGPILWQFPPNMPADEEAFAAFVELLPQRIDGRTVRHAVELRHPKIPIDRAVELLRRRRVALVAGDSRTDLETTAEFIYVHLRHCTSRSRPVTRRMCSTPGHSVCESDRGQRHAIVLSISSAVPRSAFLRRLRLCFSD